jgi:hypothetical protein
VKWSEVTTWGAPPGEDHPNAKLTEEAVRDMRYRYARKEMSIRQLAALYDVSYHTAHSVVFRRSWKHVA